ncbi:MAG: class C sortase [Carnobacterium sp.]
MKTRRIIGVVLFLFGFALILYPMISKTYYDISSREEVEQITKEIKEDLENDATSNDLYEQQVAYNQSEISKPKNIEVADVGFVEEAAKVNRKKTNYLSDQNIIGTLSIPAIDLFYPIYDGATNKNLLSGVARVDGTSYPLGGINTNSVIAGHNGYAGQTYFSRIDRLVSGNLINIQNRKELLTYEVYSTAVIKPNDVAALAVIPGQDTVTLLTCTSPPPGTHRYLVFAKRVGNNKNQTVSQMNETKKISHSQKTVEKDVMMEEMFKEAKLFIKRYGEIMLIALLGIGLMYLIFI